MGISYDTFMNDENREKILKAIRSVDPDFSEDKLKPDFVLKDIVGWDSMNSINFTISLEDDYNMDEGVMDITGEETIADVINQIDQLSK